MKLRCAVGLLLVAMYGCQKSAPLRPDNSHAKQQSITPQKVNSVDDLSTILSKEPSLSYLGYTITRERRIIEIDGIKTEVSYAVLKRGQVTVKIFDRLHHAVGNARDFGVFAFLGEGPKQLVVVQSTPRNWSHQIVQLAPNFQVIFDSQRWSVDGELILVDVNQDGVFEFSKMVTILYDFHGLPIAESPLIPILFAFDPRGNVYIPANHLFPEYALKGIEDELKSLDRSSARTYLAAVLRVLMRYIYAGRRDEGWAFYEREYTLADKDLIKSEIASKLVSEPVYRFIYG